MPQLELKRAGELERVIDKLVELFYAEFLGLDIIVVLRSREFDGSPRTVARIDKLSGVKAWLYRQKDGEQMPVFMIQVVDHKFNLMSAEQKIAVLDHELSHLEWSDTSGEPMVQDKHDIEENAQIVRRHGLWNEGLQIFNEAIQTGVDNESTRDEIRRAILQGDDKVEL